MDNRRALVRELDALFATASDGTTELVGSYWQCTGKAFNYYMSPPGAQHAVTQDKLIYVGPNEPQRKFYAHLASIMEDVSTLFAIIHRLEWTTVELKKGNIGMDDWEAYARAEVHSFHTELRSALDYLASAIRDQSANAPKKHTTFNEMRQWLTHEENASKNCEAFGWQLARLFLNCQWFDEIKQSRDALIHHGKDAYVYFVAPDTILFQAFKSFTPRMLDKVLEESKRGQVIDFRVYAGYYLARFLSALNSVCLQLSIELKLSGMNNYRWMPTRSAPAICYMHLAVGALRKTYVSTAFYESVTMTSLNARTQLGKIICIQL